MIKHLTCTDCRVEFVYDHRKGPTRQRCDRCTSQRKAETDRAKTARYRERYPLLSRDQWTESNRKRSADPDHLRRKRENEMLRCYGLTRAQYDELHLKQRGLCAICRNTHVGPGNQLHVDHCHTTKKVRGLLCAKCNTAIGLLGDDPKRVAVLLRYLRQ